MTNNFCNKLENMNKNIQLEKKKMKISNLNIENDYSVNCINYSSNDNNFYKNQKSSIINHKIRGKSELNKNNFVDNKYYEGNSLNNNNLGDRNDYQYLRNKR